MKPITLPQLELFACTFDHICKALPLSMLQATFWTGSTIALQWIKNELYKWPQFIAARTQLIESQTWWSALLWLPQDITLIVSYCSDTLREHMPDKEEISCGLSI